MTKNRKPSTIEELCKESFLNYLEKNHNIKNIAWSTGEDPPDYILKLDNSVFAVEVTTIMDKIKLEDRTFSRISIHTSLTNLVDEIKEECLKRNILNGSYAVGFNKPITSLKESRDKIKDSVIAFIKNTYQEEQTEICTVFIKGSEKISVFKDNRVKNSVCIMGPSAAKMHSVAKRETSIQLNEIINNKAKKLKDIILPKILLILNQILFLNLKDYEDLDRNNIDCNKFHTVFIVQNKESGYLFHSKCL